MYCGQNLLFNKRVNQKITEIEIQRGTNEILKPENNTPPPQK
jgi:hypothetical protein